MPRYMATMSQVLNITPQQQRWIVDHVGHTFDVHHIRYRSTMDIILRLDITKLLLVMDSGNIGKFKNKKLEDIQLEDVLDLSHENTGTLATDEADKAEVEEEYLPDLPQDDDEEEDFCQDNREKDGRLLKGNRTGPEIEEVQDLFSIRFKKSKTPGKKPLGRLLRPAKQMGAQYGKCR
ncbi:hypothetical protein HOLleu_22449 [Holothuria leucospilota]|uniref:Uncharacterized protein n=1 Tax=Holothuria leucospilota TaxID=206669 RepID=A0A9Q1H764_HOLLE|nr:hypothetical protein HOLleu_22449 [Holothuria leucospilota]